MYMYCVKKHLTWADVENVFNSDIHDGFGWQRIVVNERVGNKPYKGMAQ